MTAELVRGQNHPLPRTRLRIRVSAGTPVVAAAALGDENGTVRGAEMVAHPGTPVLPGLEVSRRAAATHRLAVDLDAVPAAVHRVSVLLALAEGAGPLRFGAVAAPFVAVTDLDGTDIASYTLTGLDTETAVVALELYRRQGAWKVRAVGQGYEGGLAALLADQGLPEAHRLATAVQEAATPPPDADRGGAPQDAAPHRRAAEAQGAVGTPGRPGERPPCTGEAAADPAAGASQPSAPASLTPASPASSSPATPRPPAASTGGTIDYHHPGRQHSAPPAPAPTPAPAPAGQPARPVAGDATGWSMDERLYNQVWGMFEDLARTVAAYRSAVDFADSRREKELDQALADPRARTGRQGDAAREAAQTRYGHLVSQAREVLDRDLTQLAAEADVVEPALPAAYARWDNPVWHAYRVPMEIPMAVRLGDLHLPEAARIRIPLLVRLPLERGLWIDCGRLESPDGSLLDTHEMRRLGLESAVAHVARLLAVYPAGEFTVHAVDPAGAGAGPLAPLVRAGVLAAPPAQGAAGTADVLARLTRRVDLVQMALRGGAADALPPGFDASQQLLVVNDFPHGFDDRAVNQLRYLADEGPAVGVHLMMVADRTESAGYGPLLDPLWRSLLRLTPVSGDHLSDPWVGHAWTYEPSLVPSGSRVIEQVLSSVAAARHSLHR